VLEINLERARNRENETFVLFSSDVYLTIYMMITRVLFIWHKKGSEIIKLIKVDSLVGAIENE
jgi:hypothetical protein